MLEHHFIGCDEPAVPRRGHAGLNDINRPPGGGNVGCGGDQGDSNFSNSSDKYLSSLPDLDKFLS